MYWRITCMIAISFFSPLSIRASTSFLKFFRVSVTMVLSTVMALAQLAEDPTARNSNLFPVNANGEVRLRSVLSINSSGMLLWMSILSILSSCSSIFSDTLSFTSCKTLVRYCPIKTEMIAGGASFAPKRWSFGADAIDALNTSA